MSLERAKEHLAKFNLSDRVLEFETSSATVELAAEAAGCPPEQIAKSLTFLVDDACVMVVAAGDAKIDNPKYKEAFHTKAKMLSPEQVVQFTNHEIGGVCPFGVNDTVSVYLDVSMKRFDAVYPAAGSSNSAIRLTLSELEEASESKGWVDVCKAWQDA